MYGYTQPMFYQLSSNSADVELVAYYTGELILYIVSANE